MVTVVPDILARIVATKRAALGGDIARRPELEKRAAERRESRDFRRALLAKPPAIIAEIKRASPSKGVLSQNFDSRTIARTYQRGGAAALSVLTDQQYFSGSLQDMEAARASVSCPVLRKDFTIDEFHVVEAAAHGADAILLIAALLDAREMRSFRELARRLRMDALVEVHDESELASAIDSGAEIIGVNNRNLHTFEVTLDTSLRLAERIPDGVTRVAESGIRSRGDVARLRDAGFDAFLIGEHLMKSTDAAGAIEELRG
jgi:indole-3-glycerol phosphate synthase